MGSTRTPENTGAEPGQRAGRALDQAADSDDGTYTDGGTQSYEAMTVEQLRQAATDADIDGRSGMNRQELLDALTTGQ